MSGITKDVNGKLTIKTLIEWREQYEPPTFPNKKLKTSPMEQDYLAVVDMLLEERTKLYGDIEKKNDEITRGHNNATGPLRGEIGVLKATIEDQRILIDQMNVRHNEDIDQLNLSGEKRHELESALGLANGAIAKIKQVIKDL